MKDVIAVQPAQFVMLIQVQVPQAYKLTTLMLVKPLAVCNARRQMVSAYYTKYTTSLPSRISFLKMLVKYVYMLDLCFNNR